MTSKKYYVNATEEEIIHIKHHQELQVWIEHLKYVNQESDQLLKLDSSLNSNENNQLRSALSEKNTSTHLLINELHTYKSTLDNFKECNDLDCDLFYIEKQDELRTKYLHHLRAYRLVKNRMYSKIIAPNK